MWVPGCGCMCVGVLARFCARVGACVGACVVSCVAACVSVSVWSEHVSVGACMSVVWG